MFGEFSISVGDSAHAISDKSNRSKKVLTFLEYLLAFRGREIPQNELIELLWPEDEYYEPENTLKTLVHRARTYLDSLDVYTGKDLIVCRHGVYGWNNSINTVIDAEEFEKYCGLAEKSQDDEARLGYMMEAIKLYKGTFLPKTSSELWAVTLSTYYQTRYVNMVQETLEILMGKGEYESVVAICQQAISIDPYVEAMHLYMIRALMNSGRQQAAINHYNMVTELFMDKFGITPSDELTQLYKEIAKTTNTTEMNLNIIREAFKEKEKAGGAFYCEIGFFKEMYRLQARSATRTGSGVQIALLTIVETGKKMSPKQMTLAMSRLKKVIYRSLRTSDVYSRFSVNQYIFLLPYASIEDGEMILERVRSNFRRAFPHMNLVFHYSCLPMEPNE